MYKYVICPAQADDFKDMAAVYNSNRSFLRNHLGVERVDEAFIAEEVESMKEVGFSPCVITERDDSVVRGVLDYRGGREVYLSLLMLSEDLQGKGVGKAIYSDFEREMQCSGSASIRIDVVNDHTPNAIPFWKKLGFIEGESVTLNWGKKKSRAAVMRKIIG